jgi:hypothetical protein
LSDREKVKAFVADAQLEPLAADMPALTSDLLERCSENRHATLERVTQYLKRTQAAVHSPV